jgi:competence protein ComEC
MNPLKVHFLNVGQGDCTIIEHPSGKVTMVDINNGTAIDKTTETEIRAAADRTLSQIPANWLEKTLTESAALLKAHQALTDPIAYYDATIGPNRALHRVIITHPDMDHMTGLYRLHEQEAAKNILNFWHTGLHDFNLANTAPSDWETSPYDKRDWDTYKALRASGDSPRALTPERGAQREFWVGDGIGILAPTPALKALAKERDQPNIISYVLSITHAGMTILLGGDATSDETWPAIRDLGEPPHVAILKASHHGRKTGYCEPAVKAMSPWLTITSVADADHDASENYRRYSENTVSLRDTGSFFIEVTDDGVLHYPTVLQQHWSPKLS